MLPLPTDTPRLRHLERIVNSATSADISKWPMLDQKDFVLIGAVVVLYSYIDLNLRRIIEAADQAGKLDAPWNKNSGKLRDSEVADAALSLSCWPDNDRRDLREVEKLRSLRNLVAHFAPRRFPADDTFLFVTKSVADYRRVYGKEPEPGGVMTAIIDRVQIRNAVVFVESVQNRLAVTTSRLERDFANGR